MNVTSIRKSIRNILTINYTVTIRGKQIKIFLFCHGSPQRCPTFFGFQLPLCYRCWGFLLGIFPLFLFQISISHILQILIGTVLILPILIDGVTQNLKIRISNNPLRLITGIMGGLGVTILIL